MSSSVGRSVRDSCASRAIGHGREGLDRSARRNPQPQHILRIHFFVVLSLTLDRSAQPWLIALSMNGECASRASTLSSKLDSFGDRFFIRRTPRGLEAAIGLLCELVVPDSVRLLALARLGVIGAIGSRAVVESCIMARSSPFDQDRCRIIAAS